MHVLDVDLCEFSTKFMLDFKSESREYRSFFDLKFDFSTENIYVFVIHLYS